MTWEFLAGGGVLALSGACWALVERVLRVRAERAMDRQQSRAERAEENYEASQLELKQQRLLLVDERERLEAVAAAQGATIADLRRRLDEVAARDPGAAADRLIGVLSGGGKQTPEPGAEPAAGLPADPAAPVAGGGSNPRRGT